MDTLWQDLRYGVRMLFKRPGFTAVAVLTLALGIGVNTAIFSIVNAVLLRPLSYQDSERLVQCYWQFEQRAEDGVTNTEYTFWKENSQSFVEVAAYAGINSGFNLSGGAEPIRVRGLSVSASFLRVLGVSPAWGRSFSPDEDLPGRPRVAVISDGLWRRYFGSDPAVMGRPVLLNGESCTILGMLPPRFQFEIPADVLVSLQITADPRDNGNNTGMIARLKSGVTLQHAQAEMGQLLPRFRSEFPGHIKPIDRGILLVPLKQHVTGDVSNVLLLFSGAAGFVLLIACANVANLLLARAAARRAARVDPMVALRYE